MTPFTPCSSVYAVKFEHVFAGWDSAKSNSEGKFDITSGSDYSTEQKSNCPPVTSTPPAALHTPNTCSLGEASGSGSNLRMVANRTPQVC